MELDWERLSWPLERLGEAVEVLGRHAGLLGGAVPPVEPPRLPGLDPDEELGLWLGAVAMAMGMECEPIELPYSEVDFMVRGAAPAIARLPDRDRPPRFLLLAGRGSKQVRLFTQLGIEKVPVAEVRARLRNSLDAWLRPETEQLLDAAGVRGERKRKAIEAILLERLGPYNLTGCWLLRLPPSANFWQQLRQERVPSKLAGLLAAQTMQQLLMILSWVLIGRAAFQGRLDGGLLLGWVLLLLGQVPLRSLQVWLTGLVSLAAGSLLKRRLLLGALRLEPEEIRGQGAGQFLGQVFESQAIEALALSASQVGLIALVELLIAGAVLWNGPTGWLELALFTGWLGLVGWMGLRFFRQRLGYTQARIHLTNRLVERMMGYRTRLVQEGRERWHETEDQELELYFEAARAMDTGGNLLASAVPRGWLLVGLLGLAPALATGSVPTEAVAVGVGGVLLAYRAFGKLVRGLASVADAAILGRRVALLFKAAARPKQLSSPSMLLARGTGTPSGEERRVVLDAQDLIFRYGTRSEPVLRGATVRVMEGERLLLEGGSGGGKSTLAAVLVGLRAPESGLLLLDGLDRHTLGADGWHRRIVAAPQFHENHVLLDTFAFNLLMGRRWPPTPRDLAEAEKLCVELGLGPLLERMPAGVMQMVGEVGWQLSHGERSRLFIARALLQKSELIVLDESFAALDPENLKLALECVLRHAPALIVIAHP